MSYIGITGFTTRAEVRAVLAAVHEALAARSRQLMCGVLATAESIGRRSGPDARKRYPARDALAGIFVEHSLLLNLVHHATRRTDLTSRRGARAADRIRPAWLPAQHRLAGARRDREVA